MSYIDIVGTLFDNSSEHTTAITSLIKDLELNKKLSNINLEVKNKLEELESQLILIGELIDGDLPIIQNKLKHVIISESDYEALTQYDDNTLYYVIEQDNNWTFGKKFPIILS